MVIAQQDSRPLIEFTLAPLFEDHGIPLAVMGVLVVFLALVLVVVFIKLLPWSMSVLDQFYAEQPVRPAAGQPAADEELSQEIRVVIAAAVAETIREPHRIVRIRGLTPEDLGWSLEGRMQHHRSHTVRQRDRR